MVIKGVANLGILIMWRTTNTIRMKLHLLQLVQDNMVQQLNTIDAKDNSTKLVHFTSIFHLHSECRPMIDYECANLYSNNWRYPISFSNKLCNARKVCPISMHVHCMTHFINLMVQTMNKLLVLWRLEVLLQSLYNFFGKFTKNVLSCRSLYNCCKPNAINIWKTFLLDKHVMFNKRVMRNTRPCLWKWQLILQMSQRFLPTFNYVMWKFLWFLIDWFFYLKWCIHLSSLDKYMMCFYVILLHHWKYVKESYALYSKLTNYFMSSQFFHSIFLLMLEASIYKVQPKYMILLSKLVFKN